MFIEQYKLDRNPFAEDSVRPLFVSQSMREVSELIRQVGKAEIQTAVISGAAGVGKTTLLSQRIRGFRNTSVCWVSPDTDTPLKLYRKIVQNCGPGAVDGTAEELHHILEVFLRHQRTRDRLSVVIVDGLERYRPEVLDTLKTLVRMRVKNLPVLQFIFLSRNDELADDILREHDGSSRTAQARHVRLAGFSLEETQSYLRICLQGAGCEWADELLPQDVVLDVQALSQGVVGDINAVCRESLERLAQQQLSTGEAPRIASTLVRAVGKSLHLRHDVDKWSRTIEETLSPDAVRVSDSSAIRIDSAHLIVSSAGTQLAEVTLNRPRMLLGRDPGCDISLDSTYLSRFQNLFVQTENGWMLIDLNSTNGCFVNGRRVREHRLRDGDSISVGHHQLKFSVLGADSPPRRPLPVTSSDDTVSTDVSDQRERWTG